MSPDTSQHTLWSRFSKRSIFLFSTVHGGSFTRLISVQSGGCLADSHLDSIPPVAGLVAPTPVETVIGAWRSNGLTLFLYLFTLCNSFPSRHFVTFNCCECQHSPRVCFVSSILTLDCPATGWLPCYIFRLQTYKYKYKTNTKTNAKTNTKPSTRRQEK